MASKDEVVKVISAKESGGQQITITKAKPKPSGGKVTVTTGSSVSGTSVGVKIGKSGKKTKVIKSFSKTGPTKTYKTTMDKIPTRDSGLLPSSATRLSGGRIKVGGLTYTEKDYFAMVAAGRTVGVQKSPDLEEREYQTAKGWYDEVVVEEERKYPLYKDEGAFLYAPIEYFPGEKYVAKESVAPVGTTTVAGIFLEGPDILRVLPGGDLPDGPVESITKEAKEAGRSVKREGDYLITRKPMYFTTPEEKGVEWVYPDTSGRFQEGGMYAPIESFFGETSQVVVKGLSTPKGMFGELRMPGSKEIDDVFIFSSGIKTALKPTITTYETETGIITKEEYTLPAFGDSGRAAMQELYPEMYAEQQAELSTKLTEQMTGARTVKGRTLTPVGARIEDELRRAENIPFLKPMADIGRAIGEELYVASQTVEYPYYTDLAIAGSAPYIRTAAEPWFQGLVAKGIHGGADFTLGAGYATAQILGVGVGIHKEFKEEFAPLALGKTISEGRLPTRTAADVAVLGVGLGVGFGVAGISYAGVVGATALSGNLGTAGLMVADPLAYLLGGLVISTAAIGTGARAATRGAQFAEEVGSGRYLFEVGAYRPGPTSAPAVKVMGTVFQEEGGVSSAIGRMTGYETKFLSSEFFGMEARVLESKSSSILTQEFAEGAIARRSIIIPESAQSFEDVFLILEGRGGTKVIKRSAPEVQRILTEEVTTLQGRTLLSESEALRELASDFGLYKELRVTAWDEFFGEAGAIAGERGVFTTTATEIFEMRAPIGSGKVPILSKEGTILGSLDEEIFYSTKQGERFLATSSTQEVADNLLFSIGETLNIEGEGVRFVSLFERVKVPKSPTTSLGEISGIGVGGDTMVGGGTAQVTKTITTPFIPTPSMVEATLSGKLIVPSRGVVVPGIGEIIAPPQMYSVAEFDVAFTAPPMAPMVQVSREIITPIKAFESALASNVVVVTKSGMRGKQEDLFKIKTVQGTKVITEEDQALVGVMVTGQVTGPKTQQKPKAIVDIMTVLDIGQPSGQRQATDVITGQVQPLVQITAPAQITETITTPAHIPPGIAKGMLDVPPPPVIPIIPPFLGFKDMPRKTKKGKKTLQKPKYKPSLWGMGVVPGASRLMIGKAPKIVTGGGIRGMLEPKKGKKKKKKEKLWWFA